MSSSVGGGKSKILILNLTSMIDICAILIIFLVMGTVIGQEDIIIPKEFKLPKSINKETLENAPQVMIYNNEVELKFLKKSIPVEVLLRKDENNSKIILEEIKNYISAMPQKSKSSGVLLNMVADGRTPYSVVYDLSKFFRQSGFQSILFVAEGN